MRTPAASASVQAVSGVEFTITVERDLTTPEWLGDPAKLI